MEWRHVTLIPQYLQTKVRSAHRYLRALGPRLLVPEQLTAEVSYRLLRAWRFAHHFCRQAAGIADADFYRIQVVKHRSAYHSLRRSCQVTGLNLAHDAVAAVDPDKNLGQPRTVGIGRNAIATALTPSEERQIKTTWAAAERGDPIPDDELEAAKLYTHSNEMPLAPSQRRRKAARRKPRRASLSVTI